MEVAIFVQWQRALQDAYYRSLVAQGVAVVFNFQDAGPDIGIEYLRGRDVIARSNNYGRAEFTPAADLSPFLRHLVEDHCELAAMFANL